MMTPESASTLRLIGSSAAIRRIDQDIDAAARSDAKVLITGETGVGKDVVARLIHQRSARRLAPLAAVNCAGLTDTLIESELFGHVRGSFTDAYRDKAGIFESAANGTVFLDEVGEMSARMQGALLRFLETGEIQRVGADRIQGRANVRLIAATNRNLQAEVASGGFRQDLYYRLHVIHISIPPVRERREDIPALLKYFLDYYVGHHRASPASFSDDAIDLLCAYDWPGNVRQLRNAVERIVLKSNGGRIDVGDLPHDLRGVATSNVTALGPSIGIDREVLGQMLEQGESFWSAVYGPFMSRDLPRAQLKAIVSGGLERVGWNYRLLVPLFNMPDADYKRFVAFLKKHHCHIAVPQPRRAHTEPRATAVAC